MKNKKYTVLLSANANEATKTFTLSASKFKILLAFTVLLSGLLFAFLVDYFQLLYSSTRAQRLQVENTIYKQKFYELEGKLEKLNQSLDRVETFSSKLRVLANLQPNNEESESKKKEKKSFKDWSFFKNTNKKLVTAKEIYREADRDISSLSLEVDLAMNQSDLKSVEIEKILTDVENSPSLINTTPTKNPVSGGVIVNEFGFKTNALTGRPSFHQGVDIAATSGQDVFATADGRVEYVGYNKNLGNYVVVSHSPSLKTKYGYLAEANVKLDYLVKRGDVIARVGNTGQTDEHQLYYEIKWGDVPVNPQRYILD